MDFRDSSVSTSIVLGFKVTFILKVGAGDQNLGFHACIASICLLSHLSSPPFSSFIPFSVDWKMQLKEHEQQSSTPFGCIYDLSPNFQNNGMDLTNHLKSFVNKEGNTLLSCCKEEGSDKT